MLFLPPPPPYSLCSLLCRYYRLRNRRNAAEQRRKQKVALAQDKEEIRTLRAQVLRMDAEITEYKARLRTYEGDRFEAAAKAPEDNSGAADEPKDEAMDANSVTAAESVVDAGAETEEERAEGKDEA